jgi:hypothetical protein
VSGDLAGVAEIGSARTGARRCGAFLGGSAPGAVDPTPPVITAAVTGTLGTNGWHRSNVTVAWSVYDPESGITNETGCDTRTFTQETAGVGRTCSATNGAGISLSTTVTLKIDKTPPGAAAALERPPDSNGWYTRQVAARFSGSDSLSGVASCSPPVAHAGPDSASAQLAGMCRDRAGNETPASVAFKYDATPPEVTQAIPARRPDRYGWYKQPVAFTFAGSDATSGLASCSSVTYSGPNSERATVAGTCRDNAGNASAPRGFALRYSRPLLTPAAGQNVARPVVLDWVNVAGARYYNVQVWKGRQKILSAWPSTSAYTFKRSWRFRGERHALERGARYRWFVWPRIGRSYGKLLGRGVFDVVRRPSG